MNICIFCLVGIFVCTLRRHNGETIYYMASWWHCGVGRSVYGMEMKLLAHGYLYISRTVVFPRYTNTSVDFYITFCYLPYFYLILTYISTIPYTNIRTYNICVRAFIFTWVKVQYHMYLYHAYYAVIQKNKNNQVIVVIL